jgi:hypothetical protein
MLAKPTQPSLKATPHVCVNQLKHRINQWCQGAALNKDNQYAEHQQNDDHWQQPDLFPNFEKLPELAEKTHQN